MIRAAAVIGCGKYEEGKEGWAQGHANAKGMVEAYPNIRLYGVDINPENLAAFGTAYDLPQEQLFGSTEAMYEEVTPDLVALATWPGLHHPQVLEAAEAGVRGIVCEKPLALDGYQIDDMIRATRAKGIPMVVAHQRRYEGAFKLVRSLIEEGRFGERIVLHARVGDGWDMLSWTTHWFDMANFFFGGPPESVLAGIDHQNERRYGHAVERQSVVFAEYSENRQAVFISGPNALVGHGFMIEGDRATGRLTSDGLLLMSREGAEIIPVPDTPLGTYASLYHELGEAVEHGTATLCDVEHCADATRMAYAAHESSLEQRRVVLKDAKSFAPLEILQHPPRPSGQSRRVTLLADQHHRDPQTGQSTRDGIIRALEAREQIVELVPLEEREVEAGDLQRCDVLMISHTVFESSEQTRRLVGDWIRSGKPTTIVHCGIGAWPDWQEFREWCGYYWIWGPGQVPSDEGKQASGHPHVPTTLKVVDQGRFPAAWKTAWLPRDEVYVHLYPGDPVHLLVTTELDGVTEPIAWRHRDRPNITVWLPGHLPEMWDLPVVQDGLMATCELALRSE